MANFIINYGANEPHSSLMIVDGDKIYQMAPGSTIRLDVTGDNQLIIRTCKYTLGDDDIITHSVEDVDIPPSGGIGDCPTEPLTSDEEKSTTAEEEINTKKFDESD